MSGLINKFPAPAIRLIDGITVIDDSVVGTKTRVAHELIRRSLSQEFFYATTPVGASPVALAKACYDMGKILTLITTHIDLSRLTDNLKAARNLGARLLISPSEDFTLVSERTHQLAQKSGGEIIDFDSETAVDVIADIAKSLNLNPAEVWSASGRGAMARAYQKAWPAAQHHAVAVIDLPSANYGTAQVIYTKTPYEEPCDLLPPFLCNPYYEAKAWQEMKKTAVSHENTVFWNPAGPN